MPLFAVATENAMIEAGVVPGTTYYMSLNSATPGQTGANEAAVTRQAIIFSTAVNGVLTSITDAQSFTSLPAEAGGLPFWSLWTALTSGTYLLGGTTTNLSTSIPAGSIANFAIGAVTVVLQS